jgi:hypothetical protein
MSQNPSIQTAVDTPIVLTEQSFPKQNYLSLSEKLSCQTSQLETAYKHIRDTPESSLLKELITSLISYSEQGQSAQSAIALENLPYTVSKLQIASERYQKYYADSFETSVALSTIQGATNAIIQALVADILQKEKLFTTEPILCGKGEFNWVYSDSEKVIYIPRNTSINSFACYQQRKICLGKFHEMDTSHPQIQHIGSKPFPHAIGDLVKAETVSSIFLSSHAEDQHKVQAAQAVGAYLHSARFLKIEGFGQVDVEKSQQEKIIGRKASWELYLKSLVERHFKPTSENISISDKIQTTSSIAELPRLLRKHAETFSQSKSSVSLILPDPSPNNFAFNRSALKACSTDWDCARISTCGEMVGRLLYSWVYSQDWQRPQYKALNTNHRLELAKSALRILIPDQDERRIAKIEGIAWLALSCFDRASNSLHNSQQSQTQQTSRNSKRFIEELDTVLKLKV